MRYLDIGKKKKKNRKNHRQAFFSNFFVMVQNEYAHWVVFGKGLQSAA